MTPNIRYATAADGVRIAYAVSGQGPALAHMPNLGASMLQVEADVPERRRWAELLSERFTLVRYDARGAGYSQREVADLSPDAHLRDLEAVAGALGLASFALFGFLTAAYAAPLYAARHPEQVSHLVLWPPDTRDLSSAEYQGLARVAAADWETFTETYAHLAMGWSQGDVAHRFAQVMRESVTAEMFQRQMTESHVPLSRALEAAAGVRAPALVLQRRMRFAGERVARLVAALPDARLHILDGEPTVPYLGNARAVADVMARFAGAATAQRDAREIASDAAARTGATAAQPPLTEREREVVRLLAEGRSNEEIAEALVVSVRTVERHLYNIYTKLGVSGKSARSFAAAHAMDGQLG